MVYTINDISEGDWITTIYEKQSPVQVIDVDYDQDLFTAMDWVNRVRWDQLKADDVHRIRQLGQRRKNLITVS